MSHIKWYPRYPGDYMRDTIHLTLEECGAYDRLMDIYYTSGKPIPNDIDLIKRYFRESKQKTRKIMEVLSDFFEEKDGLLWHKKIEFELDKSLKIHKTAVANGRAGGKATALAKAQATMAATTTTSTLKTIKHKSKSSDSDESDFQEFWINYPRKDAKKKSHTAFLNLNKTNRKKAIEDCKTRYEHTEKQFIPLATTYIHGERWNDSSIITQADKQNKIKWPQSGDCNGWVKLANEHGYSTKPGESQFDFEKRIRNLITVKNND